MKKPFDRTEQVFAVLDRHEGGVYKRLDENRELLENLQQKAPEFLKNNSWVEGWIWSQDRFLLDLITAHGYNDHDLICVRPWPGRETLTVNAERWTAKTEPEVFLKSPSNSGDQSSEESKLKAAQRSIRRIKFALFMRAQGCSGPRLRRATWMLFLSFVVVHLAVWGTSKQGLNFPGYFAVILPVVTALAVFWYVMKHSDVPRTWSDKLDHELAKHEPIDLEAYRKLQKTTMELGCLVGSEIQDWVSLEEEAIDDAIGLKSELPESRFLTRTV